MSDDTPAYHRISTAGSTQTHMETYLKNQAMRATGQVQLCMVLLTCAYIHGLGRERPCQLITLR